MAKKKSAKRKATIAGAAAKKKPAKNSLFGNINRRKKAGTSRSKENSTITPEAYLNMQQGWPKKKAEEE